MTELDSLYRGTQAGDVESFTAWVRLAEMPLRRSLRSFARSVDVEAILQEGLLRMWTLAPSLELSGADASLRYAFVLVRRLAISEERRTSGRREVPLDEDKEVADLTVAPDPPSDPRLRAIILGCIKKLPVGPRRALLKRLEDDGTPDRERAGALGMKPNTFFQNIVRARKSVRSCLEKNGVRKEEVLP